METITQPTLYYPFSSPLHPHVDLVEQRALDWACQFQIIPNDMVYQHVANVKATWLLGWAYPQAPLDALQLIADWNIWILMWDDFCGSGNLGRQPRRIAAMQEHFLTILRGTPPEHYDGPLAWGLHDIRQRLAAHASDAWVQRFSSSVELFFSACEWEATNRVHHRIPDIETYLQMRPWAIGLYPYLDLFDITDDTPVPSLVRMHPVVHHATLLAAQIICWANDIVSFEKELAQDDWHNLVLILHHTEQMPLQQAIQEVANQHDAAMQIFVDLDSHMPSFAPPLNRSLQHYLATLRSWVSANIQWSQLTGRYQLHQRTVGETKRN